MFFLWWFTDIFLQKTINFVAPVHTLFFLSPLVFFLSCNYWYWYCISHRKRAWLFIWTNLNNREPKKLRTKFAIISGKGWSFEFPLPNKFFLPSLVEIGSIVAEKKIKMWKVFNNNNDDRTQNKLNDDASETN